MASYLRSAQAQRNRPASQARGPEEIVLPFTYAVTGTPVSPATTATFISK